MRWIAHRGGIPEHSRSSLLDSLQNPLIQGIEGDVQFSRDDEPIMFHDESLFRCFQKNILVQNVELTILQKEYGLLSLQEWLTLSYPWKKWMLIEIKGHPTNSQTQRLWEIMESFPKDYSLWVASFNERWLRQWKWTPRVVLCANQRLCHDSWLTEESLCLWDAIGLSSEVITFSYVQELANLFPSILFLVYTVNDVRTTNRLVEMKLIDGIISDNISVIHR